MSCWHLFSIASSCALAVQKLRAGSDTSSWWPLTAVPVDQECVIVRPQLPSGPSAIALQTPTCLVSAIALHGC